jgi:hypothetical protein
MRGHEKLSVAAKFYDRLEEVQDDGDWEVVEQEKYILSQDYIKGGENSSPLTGIRYARMRYGRMLLHEIGCLFMYLR